MAAAVDAGVAAVLTTPGWESASVTLPAEEPITATVFVSVDEHPSGRVQRRGATILIRIADCPDQPVDGTTVITDAETWTVRTAVEGVAVWRCEAWA